MIKKIFIAYSLLLGLGVTAPLAYCLYVLKEGTVISPDRFNGIEFIATCVFGGFILVAFIIQMVNIFRS